MRQVLDSLPVPEGERFLTGFDNSEDAAVFRLDAERGIVFSIDVITPLVDDPELYGAIAAANAVSDQMLESVTVLGDAQQCRDQMAKFRQAGVDMPVAT